MTTRNIYIADSYICDSNKAGTYWCVSKATLVTLKHQNAPLNVHYLTTVKTQ